MKSNNAKLNRFQAAVLMQLSPRLIRWLARYAVKYGESRKLASTTDPNGEMVFSQEELKSFDRYLSEPWPSKDNERPPVPAGIDLEIKTESNYRCVICSHASVECAHIDPVHNSKNNHPHNLIGLCPNCHDLFDNKHAIKEAEIRAIKKDILDTQVSIWRANAGLLDRVFSLIRVLETLQKKAESSDRAAYPALQEELRDAIRSKAMAKSSIEENPVIARRILAACGSEDVPQQLVKARTAILDETGSTNCPLCDGSGSHNNWECPVCSGVGTVDAEDVAEIDLERFEQADCPLCDGSGSHNNWVCPICRGVGTVDVEDVPEIDLERFEQVDCPVCKGSGSHNNAVCPICRGVGTVDAEAIAEIDLERFEQADCPLCKGSGSHNNVVCPICSGVGTVDAEDVAEIDLERFEQVDCPVCEGSGSHNNAVCPICRGVGTVDAEAIDEIDLERFEQVDCPLCEGSGSHNNVVCSVCRGVGTVDAEAIDEIDLDDLR